MIHAVQCSCAAKTELKTSDGYPFVYLEHSIEGMGMHIGNLPLSMQTITLRLTFLDHKNSSSMSHPVTNSKIHANLYNITC
jgi:hypothetical protein